MKKYMGNATMPLFLLVLIGALNLAYAAKQSDFYGVWKGKLFSTLYFYEINKETIIQSAINQSAINVIEKNKYRIVKWERDNKKNDKYAIYALSEKNQKVSFQVSIDAYSDLNIHTSVYIIEMKKSSAAELNKTIKEATAAQAAAQAAKEAAAQAAEEAAAQKAAELAANLGSFSDERDGKTYKTAKIGTQNWMAENLNYDAEGSKCDDNNPDNCAKYGRLYGWSTAMTLPSSCNSNRCSDRVQAKHRGICPEGWHIPSNDEWGRLYRFVDGTSGTESRYYSPKAGKYLKATSGWKSYYGTSGNGTDEYGFSALSSDGGHYSNWWSANEYSSKDAYYQNMYYGSEGAGWGNSGKSYLYNVRCVQD